VVRTAGIKPEQKSDLMIDREVMDQAEISFLANDIRDGAIQALDEIVDPLIFLHEFLQRTLQRLALIRAARPWRRRLGLPGDHAATSPPISASRCISCAQLLQVKVCSSKS
jgi:hypothetical protein